MWIRKLEGRPARAGRSRGTRPAGRIPRGARRAAIRVGVLLSAAACASAPGGHDAPLAEPAARGSEREPERGAERPHRVIGYYAAWTAAAGYRPTDIPGDALTHVNYAFADIAPDLTLALRDRCLDLGACEPGRAPAPDWAGAFEEIRALKGRFPHLRVLVSVGGWGGSARFSDVARTDESRGAFARSAIERFLDDHPGVFDGFDIDWEYPVGGGAAGNVERPEDRENFTALLAELRRQLDDRSARDGKEYLLTIATAAGPRHLANLELDRITPLVDWINVMTYDYHTGAAVTNFNAPLYSGPDDPTPHLNIDASIRAYLDAGVPATSLVLGVPFFGRGFGDVPPLDHGLYQPAGTPEEGTWGVGGIRFHQVDEALRRGFRRHWHDDTRVPWLYHPDTRVWISYDDPRSIAEKVTYAREMGLGGIMIWELSADRGVLLEVIDRELRR